MRGFVLSTCAVLLVIAAGVAALAAGSTASSRPASATLVSAGGRSPAQVFAHRVLAEATVPPHAHLTRTAKSTWLQGPPETPGVSGLIDLHHLFVDDATPGNVAAYVEAHLPSGGKIVSNSTSSSPTGGTAFGFVVSLPVSGPDEFLAQLTYVFVPVSPHGTEFRVDAQTVWLPRRSSHELITGGIVELTGFSHVSLVNASSGPVTVRLPPRKAKELEAVFNSLPLGPTATCMEDALLYTIDIRATSGSGPSFEVDGYQCEWAVTVSGQGRSLTPLYDRDCSLLRAVVALLPAHEAAGTRESAVGCRNQ